MPSRSHRPPRLLVKLIFQPARLSAPATVATAPTHQTTKQTLAGKADTQSAVTKNLNFSLTLLTNCGYISQANLPRQNHPCKTNSFRLPHRRRIMQRHLSAGVQGNLWIKPPQLASKAPILHNQSVRSQIVQLHRQSQSLRQLFIRKQGVHCQIDCHTA